MAKVSTFIVEAADNHHVPAKFLQAAADRIVILTHGITTNMDEDGTYTQFAEEFLAPDFSSVRFDFRGHGSSAIKPIDTTVAGEILDLMAVIRWTQQQGYREVFHVGTSFGASVTLLAARRFDLSFLRAAVFWNPVIDYDRTFINAITEWGQEFFDQSATDALAYRKGTAIPETAFTISPTMTMELLLLRPQDTAWPRSTPLLVLHGDQDTLVPCEDAKAYCDRNGDIATFIPLDGVDHGFDDKLVDAFVTTVEWFRRYSGIS